MSSSTASTRLAFKLAARDIRRYKGRSLLAALLIFVPVLAMAGLLSFVQTVSVDGAKQNAEHLKASAASVEFEGGQEKPAVFPAAGKVVGPPHAQPTTEQIAQQAHANVTRETSASVRVAPHAGATSFTPTDGQLFIQTDLASPMVRPTVTLDSGRWPTKPGEVLVTRVGLLAELPKHGVVDIAATNSDGSISTGSAGTLKIVGTATSVTQAALLGPAVPALTSHSTTPTFLIGGAEWKWPTIKQWTRYGATVETRTVHSASPEGFYTGVGGKVVVAIGTMGFIAVTALLAGPAFAASATRQRRTLGLIAANGARRSVLRRIVLAQAVILGVLTAVCAVVLGGLIGCLFAKWIHLYRLGTPAPTDIPVSWLVGVVIVSTIASLIAAAVPARSAGRTNLLAALRGQVSSRVVHKRWPVIGLLGIGLGTLCLLGATNSTNESDQSRNVLLAYLGVPLFFGGAVWAVPFVLVCTGRLASKLPVSARIAVRDVSRQRTRATASIGAVLATVAVLCAVSIYGASADKAVKRDYVPQGTIGSGTFTSQASPYGIASSADAQELKNLAAMRALVTHATPLWSPLTASGVPRLTAGSCSSKSSNNDPWAGADVIALETADTSQVGLSSADQELLRSGGALVVNPAPHDVGGPSGASVSPHSIHDGKLTLRDQNPLETNSAVTQRDCRPVTFSARALSAKPKYLQSVTAGAVIVSRETLTKHQLPLRLSAISLDPVKPMSKKTEHQVGALTPPGMALFVERGYQSPVGQVLALLTAGFALIVLLTTVVSTLLNDAESRADMATLAATGASRGMRRRIVAAHAAAIGFIGAVAGIAVGFVPGLVLARATTREWGPNGPTGASTYAVSWWPLLTMLVLVPIIAALISMVFARRAPSLTRREA